MSLLFNFRKVLTRRLRFRLERAPGETALIDRTGRTLKMEPLATVSSLERYLQKMVSTMTSCFIPSNQSKDFGINVDGLNELAKCTFEDDLYLSQSQFIVEILRALHWNYSDKFIPKLLLYTSLLVRVPIVYSRDFDSSPLEFFGQVHS